MQGPLPDGCVVLIENGQSRIVAGGICFANGLTLDATEKYLYVAETMKRRILRYQVARDGSLSGMEVYGPNILGTLGYPDGIAFDEAGNLWITFPSWNAVGYLTPGRNWLWSWKTPMEKSSSGRPTSASAGRKEEQPLSAVWPEHPFPILKFIFRE